MVIYNAPHQVNEEVWDYRILARDTVLQSDDAIIHDIHIG